MPTASTAYRIFPVSPRRWSANGPISRSAAGSRTGPQSPADAPLDVAGRDAVHPAEHGPASDRHPQRPARHDPPRRRRPQAPAEPDGACVGMPQSDRQQWTSLRRAARDDRIHRLFAGQGAEPARWRAHPARSVCAQAVPMIAQLILSALLAAILLYAWAEYRRSPAVAFLTVAIATAGLYFVWMPEHSTQLAELVGIGRGVDLILYVWVCISLVVLLNLHLKLRTQTELITMLARKIAITDAQSRNA